MVYNLFKARASILYYTIIRLLYSLSIVTFVLALWDFFRLGSCQISCSWNSCQRLRQRLFLFWRDGATLVISTTLLLWVRPAFNLYESTANLCTLSMPSLGHGGISEKLLEQKKLQLYENVHILFVYFLRMIGSRMIDSKINLAFG